MPIPSNSSSRFAGGGLAVRPRSRFFTDLTLAFHIAVLIFAMVVGVLILIAGASIANAATLKSVVQLNGPVLTAGDLFDGLDKDIAARVLGPAPLPGQDVTLNALALMRVAAALDSPWQPQNTTDQAIVSSAGTLVDQKTIGDALMKSLQDKGVKGRFTLSYLNEPGMVLPQGMTATAEVTKIAYHPESERFEATVVAPGAAHPASHIDVTGHVERIVSVPMLKKPMRGGDVISEADVEWTDMPANMVQPDFVIEANQIVGKTPRRMILAEQPVRTIEVAEPLLVSHGQDVTIIYNKGPITVTAKGRAMEDGARGYLIHVVNSSSNRAIDATVSDSGTVTVED
jgi:flagella basal body P-ring formation protein FlgA